MTWYSSVPTLRARQMGTDVFVLGWVILWILIGRFVYDVVTAVAGPVRTLNGAGTGFSETMNSATDRLASTPLIGDQLTAVFGSAAQAGTTMATAGTNLAETIERLGLILAVVVALSPISLVVLPWLVNRTRFVLRARAARRLLNTGAGIEVFALRALTHQSPQQLARLGPDPAGAWRRGDPEITRRLAALELRETGVRLPPAATEPRPGS